MYKLHKMASIGDRDFLIQHLQKGETHLALNMLNTLTRQDLLRRDKNWYFPIHYAVRLRHKELVQTMLMMMTIEDLENNTDINGNTALHFAAMELSDIGMTIVEQLVTKAGDSKSKLLEHKTSAGNTAVHHAVLCGNTEVLRWILSLKDVDLKHLVNIENEKQETALHFAAAHHNGNDMTDMLLKVGADITKGNYQGRTPFLTACTKNNLDILRLFVNHENTVFLDRDNDGNNCLTIVAKFANEHTDNEKWKDVTQLCLTEATVDVLDKLGRCPLHWAAINNSPGIVSLLLEQGNADPYGVDGMKNTALHLAAERGSVQAAEILLGFCRDDKKRLLDITNKGSLTPLHLACLNGHKDTVDLLLKEGANFCHTGIDQQTVFHMAVAGNNEQLLKRLTAVALKDAVNVSKVFQVDRNGNNLLHVAAELGYVDIVKYLVDELHFSVTDQNINLETPVHLAAGGGRLGVIKVMLQKDKNAINSVDHKLETALHKAVIREDKELCSYLIKMNANIDTVDNSGYTPLMSAAAARKCTNIIQILLEGGADINYKGCEDFTAIHVAALQGNQDNVETLLSWQCDVKSTVWNNETAFDLSFYQYFRETTLPFLTSVQWETLMKDNEGKIDRGRTIRMIKTKPEAALLLFDKCCSEFGEVDYRCIVSNTDEIEEENLLSFLVSTAKSTVFPSSYIAKHPLNVMVQEKRIDLLEHKLVDSLLRKKWQDYGLKFYIFAIIWHLLELVFLTSYLLSSTPPYEQNYTSSLNDSMSSNRCAMVDDDRDGKHSFLKVAAIIITFFAGLNIGKEIWRMVKDRLNYFLSLENWIDLIQYITSILFVIDNEYCLSVTGYRNLWQWNCGTVAVFLSWINMSFMMQRFDVIGIYMVMFQKVLTAFLKFILVFIWFIFAFAFAFHSGIQNQKTFKTYWKSLAKTAVMMTGEYEYEAIFVEDVVFPNITMNFLFFLFVFLVAIVIMNLLIGLALDNVQEVQKQAKFTEKKIRIGFLLELESFFPKFRCRPQFNRDVVSLPLPPIPTF